jgi:hypothetical protein
MACRSTGTNYCANTSWVGITCNGPTTITALNLTALNITAQSTAALALLDIVAAISNLTELHTLVLAGIGLSGPAHEDGRPGLDAFVELRHLDISRTPAVTGSLPGAWFAMRALTTLDISNTGISGTLPEDYAAFQELQEFRAVNCSGIAGLLPPSWGLLQLEVLEITNSALTGGLPEEWADAAALQEAATTLAASLQGKAVAATTRAPLKARDAPSSAVQASVQPVALGLEQLRVLDLSVSGPGRRRLAGALPASFAQLKQLQVSTEL